MTGERRGPRSGGHETWDELAVGWALHALEPADEAEFTRHLPDCGRCARTVTETAEVMGSLAAELPAVEPAPELRERLREAVAQTPQVGHRPPPPRPPDSLDIGRDVAPRRRPATGFPSYDARPVVPPVVPPAVARAGWTEWRARWPVAVAAFAVAVIAALGAWNVILATSQSDARATVARQEQVVDELLRPGQATIAPLQDAQGHAVATVVVRGRQVQVVTYGLVVNDRRATTYVLWATGTGPPAPLGTFDVVAPGLDLATVGSGGARPDGFTAVEISIEPGRRAPAAPTNIVAKGKVTS